MNKWNDMRIHKLPLDKQILIYRQGYDEKGKHWSTKTIVIPVKYSEDRRKTILTDIDVTKVGIITHWMELPESPRKIKQEMYKERVKELLRRRSVNG